VAKVTFLLGLAGSGKSFLADKLQRETGAQKFEGTEGNEKQTLLAAMVQHLKGGGSCTVEEIAYCHSRAREEIVAYLYNQVAGLEIEWICFENDVEGSNWNVERRKNKGYIDEHLAINRCWHNLYTYPADAKIIRITRINETTA